MASAILGPDTGELACNEHGEGRMLEPADLFTALVASRQPKVLAGKRVLLTAGPTFEAIDPVRGITNSSSGKMGFALAQAAAEAGAQVTVVAGPSDVATPAGVTRIDVDQRRATWPTRCWRASTTRDIFIGVAAVADYTPAAPHEQKLKKSPAALTLTLKPTVDILATVARAPRRRSASASRRRAMTSSATARKSASARSSRC